MTDEQGYIGFADMHEDRSLRIELRATPGGVRHRTVYVLKPDDQDYQLYLNHIRPDMQPGQSYGIKPFPANSLGKMEE